MNTTKRKPQSSADEIARLFGIPPTLARHMLRVMPTVNFADYQEHERDPGTGFPRWQAVCEHRRQAVARGEVLTVPLHPLESDSANSNHG